MRLMVGNKQVNNPTKVRQIIWLLNIIKQEKIQKKVKLKTNFSFYFHFHHKVVCDEPCYTLMFMGRKKSNTTVKLRGKKYYLRKGTFQDEWRKKLGYEVNK